MTAADSRPTERFSDRVADYVKYRPSYPPEAIRALREGLGVAPPARAADLGAGTGIFSALLLDEGFAVIAVEPNEAMRAAAQRTLADRPAYSSVHGTAEATGLPDASVDFAVAAQAFHWFDPAAARREIARITRPPHPVALVWNTRSLDATPFLRAYDELLLRVSDDYIKVRHQNVGDAVLAEFYGAGGYERRVFASAQVFDLEGFLGRAFSSSYVPAPDHPRRDDTERGLREIFLQHQNQGTVSFLYDTEVYLGCLASSGA